MKTKTKSKSEDNMDARGVLANILWQERVEDSYAVLNEHKDLVASLHKEFDKSIKHNRVRAKKSGSNFLEYAAKQYDLKVDNLDDLVERIRFFVKKLNEEIPADIKNKEWFTTIFNGLNFTDYKKYKLPKVVFDVMKNDLAIPVEKLNRIEIVPQKDDNFYCRYDFNKHIATIEFDLDKDSIGEAIYFAHECGHALEFMRIDDLKTKTKDNWYLHEKEAITMSYKVGKLLDGGNTFLIGSMLDFFRNTLFEYSVYVEERNDYDVAYAEANNAVIVGAKQSENPLYVFDNFLKDWPGYTTLYSVICVELLEKQYY